MNETNIVLLGPPGAGKGTQASRLRDDLDKIDNAGNKGFLLDGFPRTLSPAEALDNCLEKAVCVQLPTVGRPADLGRGVRGILGDRDRPDHDR